MPELLRVEHLYAGYDGTDIIKDISFSLDENEILGIVGESGSGKSTLIKALAQIQGMNVNISSGNITFEDRDFLNMSWQEKRKLHGSRLSMVFQNAESSLNPIRKLGVQFYETINAHKAMDKKSAKELSEQVLVSLGLNDTDRILTSYPFELSGGMAQRTAIALAVILGPKLILADEPTSALDATIQKQVVEELMLLRERFNTAIIIITHNIGVVKKMADNVAVMYEGRIVEYGTKERVINSPRHEYTKKLLAAVQVYKNCYKAANDR